MTMIEAKRRVVKEVEETVKVELKPYWVVRVLRPNGSRTYFCCNEQTFDHDPSEEEIANVLLMYQESTGCFAGVCKNFRLIEVGSAE